MANLLKAICSILLIQFSLLSFCQQKQEMILVENFGKNEGNLKMYLHNTDTNTVKKPLVVVLHGCGQTAKSAAELSGWNKIADSGHFMVLYPQQKFWNNPDLCFNWFNKNDIERNKGECASIAEMIQFALENYLVNKDSIFITGFSAGAAMCVAMMAAYPELFKSGASFAGAAYKLADNAFEGIKVMMGKRNVAQSLLVNNVQEQYKDFKGTYPTMIIYQGKNDPVVNPVNAQYIADQWNGLNNIDTAKYQIINAYMGIKNITRKQWLNADSVPKVILYEVNNLGHRLLVKPGAALQEGGRIGTFGVNIGYHATYYTARDFGLIKF